MITPIKYPVFLKGIHIQGFKSFADRVKIELGHGLSVIVGPNGSGKSNVADAVRWVLGEQSAKSLRGSKMEDVIFAGSTGRRPVGMAEVTLIFDNSTGIFPLDFREVTISRRVYRDGEGQYFINKTHCRLKDVQELFMDTGAGKEGFSIIGQGRVEEILNLKSEERRSLIEEAAGITKYRFRKKEAMKRLDDTVLNLQRIDDILQEIEGQLTPLAAQAQVAEQSLALTAEQKRLEIQWIVQDLSEIKVKLSSATKDSESLQTDLVEEQTLLGLKESQLIEDKVKLKKIDDEIQQSQSEVYQAEQALNALKHDRSLRIERFGYFDEQISRLTQEILENEYKLKQLHEKVVVLNGKYAVLKKTVEESLDKVSNQEQKLKETRKNNLEVDIDRIKGDLFKALSEQANYSNELTGTSHKLDSLNQQVLQLEQERSIKEEESHTLKESLISLELEQNQMEAQAKDTEQDDLKARNELAQIKKYHQEKSQELQKLKPKTEQTRARLHALQSLEDSLEGYQRGVREVMQAKKKGITDCLGLCGTVADLITVNADYELAVETALGAGVQNVVAENERVAKSAIAYLKSHQFGRVTFLPLDVIQGQRMSVNSVVERDPGYIGVAVDLITYDPLFRPAMEFLLGRIIVVNDLESATRIGRASGYRLRIVTLDGDQIHPGGSLSGGSIQRKGGQLLSRQREIESLRVSLLQLERDLVTIEQECLEIETRQHQTLDSIGKIGSKQQDEKERLVLLRAKKETVVNQIRRVTAEGMGLDLRCKEAIEQKNERSFELTTYTERLGLAEKASLDLREEFNQRELEAKAAAGEIESHGMQLTDEKVRLAKWEQELSQCTEQLELEYNIIRESELSLEQKKQNREKLEQTRQAIKDEELDLTIKVEEQTLFQEKQQYLLMLSRQNREGLDASLIEMERGIESHRQSAYAVEQRLHANEIRLARWETEWQTGVVRLVDEFALSWEEGLSYQTEEDRLVLGQRVQALKRKIEELGPINQAALEEYPKMRERQKFMLSQQNDLVEANQTLRQLIFELDKTMSERFAESFAEVNSAFQEVFKELFHGGNAELRLVDPDHLLETGVEIIAQPPGKRPQLLSLLSGGERALTAIALLFGLLRVKPSPFCILDEIEASLDDANVHRFAQYIHRLSHSTQFVVISHRKGTMESADVLYGITMEESGVSKLLSVQMDERQEAPFTA